MDFTRTKETMRVGLVSAALLPALACSDAEVEAVRDDAASGGNANGGSGALGGAGTSVGGTGVGASGAGGTGGAGGVTSCPVGVVCVTSFPFHDERDTSTAGASALDVYSCKLDADESGPEIVYRVTVPSDGFLSVVVYDDDNTDIDVHILASQDGNDCLDRGDAQAKFDVDKGDVWVVADTWVDGSGDPQSGPYAIDIGFIAPSTGPCDMDVGQMERVGDGGNTLAMPATGPIVKEAHLVTQDEPAPYPSTATDELLEHYALTQAQTGYVMLRQEPWAPLEGGSFYGAGIGDPAALPVLHEAYYVNMFWTAAARPPKGTRMILRHPQDPSRAVVVAAGYETGPGDLSRVGGTPEEPHHYLGTGHLDELTLGIATDQSLPFGPRRCQ